MSLFKKSYLKKLRADLVKEAGGDISDEDWNNVIERIEKPLHPDKYFRCDECGGIWMRGQSKEDMEKEYKENFPYDPEMKIPRGIICEDCYQELYKQTEGFTKNGVSAMNKAKKVEMKITCKKCRRTFKTYVFTERLCPKCKNKDVITPSIQPECKGCIYVEDCNILAYQTQEGGNSECIILKLKKSGEN